MRLGFSVAINVNPEILLIDEVLAVGDASFIPKCLDRIDDFRRRKKTILFVSHDLATVEKICDRVIWLKNGRIAAAGEPKRIVDAYLQDVTVKQEKAFEKKSEEAAAARDRRPPARSGARTAGESARSRSAHVTLRSLQGQPKHVFSPGRRHDHRDGRRRARAATTISSSAWGSSIPRGSPATGPTPTSRTSSPCASSGEGRVEFRIEQART